jgi:N-carbamoyl-L-amino-acid hydrolase
VATVGRLTVSPNTTNVIPGQVVLTVDLRDLAQPTIDRFTARFEQLGREIGAATSTTFRFTQMVNSAPAISDGRLLEAIEASANALGLSHQRMPSGAGHDAQEVAHIAPMAMIFIPSVGGISHSPKEFSRPGDITHGANVLLQTVVAADRALP